MAPFKNRKDAGKKLAEKLLKYSGRDEIVILALPRGGVPVAFEVAKALKAPLDIFMVRKLGVPGHEELAMGAIAMGGVKVLNNDVISMLNISDNMINKVITEETEELNRRTENYRGNKPLPDVKNKIVILIDDGLATGASMKAAITALKLLKPEKIIAAVPTSSEETCEEIKKDIDEIICAFTPEIFRGVGQWYIDFSQTTDEEVKNLIKKAENF